MSVSTYNNDTKRYRIDKLENVVYLVSEAVLKDVKIDNGEAFVNNISEMAVSMECYNLAFEETQTFDERYKFSHQLSFSMNGYANHNDFQGKYYVIIKTYNGEFWLINPFFPCKVTYTYTLGYNDNHTDFTLSTMSQHPALRIPKMNYATPYHCNGYQLVGIDKIFMNENLYSSNVGNEINYTNNGFKYINCNNKSAVFTEQFDGKTVTHSLSFEIKFDDYKSSWHYNLLEFKENTYAVVMELTNGDYVLSGFKHGLRPKYTITSDSRYNPDFIKMELQVMYDSGELVNYVSNGRISPILETSFVYTKEYAECVDASNARYLLKKEVDAFGNPTRNYQCLVGYEDEFSFLHIVGTFGETETFHQESCYTQGCSYQSSFPNEFVFNGKSCRLYSFICDTDWTMESSSDDIRVSPSNGTANTAYTIEVCNSGEVGETPKQSTITLNYCVDETKVFNVLTQKGNSCFTAGAVFDIGANAQYLTVPSDCCISSVADPTTLTKSNIYNNYFRVYVPQNLTGVERSFELTVNFCGGKSSVVTINQGTAFENWITDGYQCDGNDKYALEWQYTGTTAADCNTKTNVTRLGVLIEENSLECVESITRWIDTTATTCYDDAKWIIQQEEISYDGGTTWSNTNKTRRGEQVDDLDDECKVAHKCTIWKRLNVSDDYTCENGSLYYRERQYYSDTCDDCSSCEDLYPTMIYRKGDLIETSSSTCCQESEYSSYNTKWEVDGYTCEGTDKYEKIIFKYYEDGVWKKSCVVKNGSLIETDSSDCGKEELEYEYEWVLSTNTQCGDESDYETCVGGKTLPQNGCSFEEGQYSGTSYTTVCVKDCVVTIPSSTFYNCTQLETVNFPLSVTTLGDSAFRNCSRLKLYDLPINVKVIPKRCFSKCTSLTGLYLDFITEIDKNAFEYCTSLRSFRLGNNVRIIGDAAFYECTNLMTLTVPSSVIQIGNSAFERCGMMRYIWMNSSTPPSLGNGAFDMTNDCPIYVPDGAVETYKAANKWSEYSDRIKGQSEYNG